MRNQRMSIASRYLYRFDQILNEMADKMLNVQMTNSITINFIQCMIPHHQAAIYMCENLLQYTTYKPLQEIAHDIIQMQTRGIEQMRDIAKTTPGFFNAQRDLECYITKYFEITKDMISKMRNAPRAMNVNLNFVNEMIPHHEGAIAMCDNVLQYYIDPRLRNVALNIIREQSEGVEELKQIRKNFMK